MPRNLLLSIICSLLILLFVYTSVSKLADINRYVLDMNNQPFPKWMKTVLIPVVPLTEIAVAALLIFDSTRLAGLYGSFILMTGFTFYISIILIHVFKYVPCSCFGVIKSFSWKQHLLLNLFFLLISIIGILIQPVKNIFMHENRGSRKPVKE